MKQAIILIHGIGEQKPMDTLRRFVDALLGTEQGGRVTYWNKPDRMSELFELRRLSATGRTTTHYYEYYWAWNVEGTTLLDVVAWLLGLMFRSRDDVPPNVRPLWWICWLFAIGLAALVLSGGLAWLYQEFAALKVLGALSILLIGVTFVLQWVAVAFIGDAARYLSPRPRNIRLRQSIRSQGVALLRELQRRGPAPYDRIVLVGHSLGSVIAYDLITRLWQEQHDDLPGLADPTVRSALRSCRAAGVSPQPMMSGRLEKAAKALPKEPAGDGGEAVRAFQSEQQAAWRELRGLGNPWRITDLVTIGSPLAHAMLLMAGGKADLGLRQRQRELPTCPPQEDKNGFGYDLPPLDLGGYPFSPLVYHHAASFAVTRWTNLYFPISCGIFGDIVGGPLAPVFGSGIRDVAVRTTALGGWAAHTPLAHTRYWHAADRDLAEDGQPLPSGLKALKAALAVDQLRHFRPVLPSVENASDGRKPAGQGRVRSDFFGAYLA